MATIGKLVYSKYGDINEVLSLDETEAAPTELKTGQAHVRVLLSPVNPSDVLLVEGSYPIKQKMPGVPGLEGVSEIVRSSSGKFKAGDRVLVRSYGWGMWRQEGVVDETSLVPLPKELPAEIGATLVVNPCTAYLMLRKIVPLESGDVVILNAANSALGTTVIQMGKALGLRTVNVIRNRPNLQEVVDKLKGLGADAVITEEQLKDGLAKLNLDLPAPKLALECVGGESALHLAAALADGGTMAVYGVLTGKPIQVSQNDLIFRSIKVDSFWLTKWFINHQPEAAPVMKEVAQLYLSGKIEAPTFHTFPLSEWKEAVKAATKGFTNEKVLIKFN